MHGACQVSPQISTVTRSGSTGKKESQGKVAVAEKRAITSTIEIAGKPPGLTGKGFNERLNAKCKIECRKSRGSPCLNVLHSGMMDFKQAMGGVLQPWFLPTTVTQKLLRSKLAHSLQKPRKGYAEILPQSPDELMSIAQIVAGPHIPFEAEALRIAAGQACANFHS